MILRFFYVRYLLTVVYRSFSNRLFCFPLVFLTSIRYLLNIERKSTQLYPIIDKTRWLPGIASLFPNLQTVMVMYPNRAGLEYNFHLGPQKLIIFQSSVFIPHPSPQSFHDKYSFTYDQTGCLMFWEIKPKAPNSNRVDPNQYKFTFQYFPLMGKDAQTNLMRMHTWASTSSLVSPLHRAWEEFSLGK